MNKNCESLEWGNQREPRQSWKTLWRKRACNRWEGHLSGVCIAVAAMRVVQMVGNYRTVSLCWTLACVARDKGAMGLMGIC